MTWVIHFQKVSLKHHESVATSRVVRTLKDNLTFVQQIQFSVQDAASADPWLTQQATPCAAPGKQSQQGHGYDVLGLLQTTEKTASVQAQSLSGKNHKEAPQAEATREQPGPG